MGAANIRIADFQRVVFFTGAGLSAESGIETYRGAGGVWHKYRWEEYACQRAFERDPEKVWDFHDERRAHVASSQPNAAHRIIAAVQDAKPSTCVITQNIDGLLQRAGCRDVVELHGSLWRLRCDREDRIVENTETPLASRRCACGAYWRPDIVWFQDLLSSETLDAASDALTACDLLVTVGTSGLVYPAADLPRIAMRNGAVSVEVNLEETSVSHLYTHSFHGKASEVLRSLWE